MRNLAQRLQNLEKSAPEALAGFYEPHLHSFSVQPGASVNRISITSTCYGLQAILAAIPVNQDPSSSLSSSNLYQSLVLMDTKIQQLDSDKEVTYVTTKSSSSTPVRTILQDLLLSEWREDDLFQVPLLLYTVLKIDHQRALLKSLDERLAARMRKLFQAVLGARPRRRDGMEQTYSDYILFQCSQVYATMYDGMSVPATVSLDETALASKQENSEYPSPIAGIAAQALPDGISSQLSLALLRCVEVSTNELCRQLALRSAGDTSSFDVMRLAYSLLTYIVSTESLAGTAGRELIPGQGPSPGSRIRPVNRRLVQAALAAFFAEQQGKDGLWSKGQPIYRSFRRTGRNVGNAFIFPLDTLASLLEKLPAEDFRPHLGSLIRSLEWIERHQTVEILPDYCDPESGQCYGKSLRGWVSPHLSPETGPQAWSTAQTIACISRMKSVVETLMHEDVLTEFRGSRLSAKGASPEAWNRLLDSDLSSSGTQQMTTLKEALNQRMIRPRMDASTSLVPSYSAILFGPPGTAKTTICEAFAQNLGWDFLVIDTSVFLADGLTNVASRIRYVFERLQALRNCVILFDEIEEFCLDRETPGLGMESRMLTTAMLTAINDLRRAKNSVFFLATNRLRAFDAAIIRPGRFDMQLFVGTPNLEARSVQFRQKLATVAVEAEVKKAALTAYETYLSSVWDEEAKYMNYLEGMQFASACANLVEQGGELLEEQMGTILKSQAAVMTVRGAVREEFIASMDLTRL